MSELPNSWLTCTLGDVVSYGVTRKIEPLEISDDMWVLELEEIEKDTSKLLGRMTFAERQSKSTKNRFDTGDVLYGKLRPYLNKILIADQAGCCTTEIIPLKSGNLLNNRYLFYWLKHPEFLSYVEAESHGMSMPRLGTDAGRNAPFVLAPLPEQKRIADKLDAVLARVDACRDRLDNIPAILIRFRQSVLAAATSGKFTEDWRAENVRFNMVSLVGALSPTQKARRGVSDNATPASDYVDSWDYPKTWWKGTAASLLCKGVFIDLKDGNHGANHPVVSDFTDCGLPFITAAQVDKFVVDYDSAYKIAGAPLEKLRVGFAKSGDVVLTHKGSVGRVGIIDQDCVLTPQTTYYRLNTQFVLPKFLMYFMASQPFSGQLDEVKSQTTRDFVPITQQYALVHLLPPLDEQTEIVRRVESLFAYADLIEARYAAARDQVEKLTPSTLAKAFRGELVPQDPNDEPASALLERINIQRAGHTASKSKRGRKSAG